MNIIRASKILLLVLFFCNNTIAQIALNQINVHENAAFMINSDDNSMTLPVVLSSGRLSMINSEICPPEGMLVYDSLQNACYYFVHNQNPTQGNWGTWKKIATIKRLNAIKTATQNARLSYYQSYLEKKAFIDNIHNPVWEDVVISNTDDWEVPTGLYFKYCKDGLGNLFIRGYFNWTGNNSISFENPILISNFANANILKEQIDVINFIDTVDLNNFWEEYCPIQIPAYIDSQGDFYMDFSMMTGGLSGFTGSNYIFFVNIIFRED